ncbi:Tetraspanin [Gryllus bimaculatus]|nr:Tetraspanin [Gryllus bimaculatus]
MAYDCGTSLAKYLLCIFNFVLFFQQFTYPTVIEQASYILIAAGSLVFLVSFLGYCGALRESQCLLTCYGVFLVIILLMEITAGALAAAYRKEAEQKARTFLKNSIKDYYGPRDQPDAVTLMWNYFMAELKCCGVDDYKDFASSKWQTSNTSLVVPEACCELQGDRADFKPLYEACPRTPSLAWKDGCYDKFMAWLLQHMTVVIAVGIGLGLLQLLGIFLAFCLCRSIDGYIK